jgi:hypothetical protein
MLWFHSNLSTVVQSNASMLRSTKTCLCFGSTQICLLWSNHTHLCCGPLKPVYVVVPIKSVYCVVQSNASMLWSTKTCLCCGSTQLCLLWSIQTHLCCGSTQTCLCCPFKPAYPTVPLKLGQIKQWPNYPKCQHFLFFFVCVSIVTTFLSAYCLLLMLPPSYGFRKAAFLYDPQNYWPHRLTM